MIELTDTEAKMARVLHKNSIVIDIHSDIMLDVIRRRQAGSKAVISKIHIPRMRQGGVDAYFGTVGGDFPGGVERIEDVLRNIDWMHLETEESHSQLIIAKTTDEIRQAKKQGQIAAFLITEGLRCINWDTSLLRTLFRLGIRSCAFTWNWRNYLADRRLERSGGGLSTFGVEVLREMNRLGMIPDIAHISHHGKDDILKLSDGPVIASHLGAKGVYDMPANLSDQQIEMLASKGGVIGVIFFSPALSKGHATINDVVKHIEYITDLVGIDYVSLGPDFYDYMVDDTLST
ncbi:MAG: dipeptidase [Candidatus Heimdallarchaeota archaeon]